MESKKEQDSIPKECAEKCLKMFRWYTSQDLGDANYAELIQQMCVRDCVHGMKQKQDTNISYEKIEM